MEIQMKVKNVEKHELKKLLDLYQYLFNDDAKVSENTLVDTWNIIQNNQDFFNYYTIESNNIFVSSCNIAIVPNLTRGSRPFAVIENVITHPDFRRRGLGKMVVEKAINFAKSKKCYKIMLLSNSMRKEAHKFYEAIGFNGNEKIGFILKFK